MIEIKKLETDHWEIFRTVRLKAVAENPQFYLTNLERESAHPDTHWQETLADKKHAIFALMDKQKPIGLTAIFTWREDPNERTALLAMSYIDPAYRGKGYADLLYKARIDWAKAQPNIERIVVGHREGNEASRRANQRHGFVFIGEDEIEFGDGSRAIDKHYELKIK